MARPVRSGRIVKPRWTAVTRAAAAGLACAALTAGMTGAATPKTATAHRDGSAGPGGPFVATPVHPERLTHPADDHMGSTIPSHERRPGVATPPSLAVQSGDVPRAPGIDVSAYQGNVDWHAVGSHIDFSYAKATEGTYYQNPYFANQYNGPYQNKVWRGAYHFAIPDNSSGQRQADYFIAHGGGWSPDGWTLPGTLDIEYNPYGSQCYGLTQSQMVSWIWNFVKEYHAREHVYPVIYSTTQWWNNCTGGNTSFGRYDPLWIANYSASGGGPLPAGWRFYTFWQYADSGNYPGDQDVFNGGVKRLKVLAKQG